MSGIMKATLPTVLAIALSAVAVTAGAAEGGKDKQSKEWPSFRKADADSSGAVSQDEARSVSGLGTNFSQYDKNNDGQLSRSEYESAKKAQSSAGRSGASGSAGSSGSSAGGSGSSTGSKDADAGGGKPGSSGASGSGSR